MSAVIKAFHPIENEWKLISYIQSYNLDFASSSLIRRMIRGSTHNPQLTLNAINQGNTHDAAESESTTRKDAPHAKF